MVLSVGGRQLREEVLRQGVEIPRGQETSQPIQDIAVWTVAVTEAQARHPAMLAHAADNQQMRKLIGEGEEARDRIAGEVDERFVHDHKLQVLCLLQESHHLLERNQLT